jgi:hypothetical protein
MIGHHKDSDKQKEKQNISHKKPYISDGHITYEHVQCKIGNQKDNHQTNDHDDFFRLIPAARILCHELYEL